MTPQLWLRRGARLAALVASVLLVAAGVLATGTAARAASGGFVRLAHLSPDTPQVDVYLAAFRGGKFSKTFPGVGYGTVSPYEPLAAGTYTVSMRPAGSDPSSPPVLSTNVEVRAGRAYTVAGVGAQSDLQLRVLDDRLDQPAPGRASVRVVQASLRAPTIDVVAAPGRDIVAGATFPSTTGYVQVPAQRWRLMVRQHGSTDVLASRAVTLRAGSINTVLVLDGANGVQMRLQADAAGSARPPTGGVAAGLGGSAVDHSRGLGAGPTGVVVVLLLVGAGAALATTWRVARR